MRVFLFLATALIIFSCNNDSNLNYCPSTNVCTINSEDKVQLIERGSSEYIILNQGVCQTGEITCSQKGIVECKEYIGPSEEICDRIDNDCNNLTDEHFDKDGDLYTTCNNDCDDNDPNIHPNAPEICDGLDNNCDGEIDPIDIDNDGDFFTPCNGDCDDNNYDINPNAPELCNSIDDNCNEIIDEEVEPFLCGPETNVGLCDYGEEICMDGESLCIGAQYSQTESCNNIDDNCNGDVDEGLYRPCQTLCGSGLETCNEGYWVNCNAPGSSVELCNNIDDDCDGIIDEDCPCILGDTQTCRDSPMYDVNTNDILAEPYPCGEGLKLCDVNGNWSECYFLRNTEETCNSWDDDCDGVIDHISIPCSDFSELAGIGQCEYGESYCELGTYTLCEDQTYPQPEICDGIDNNCNGEIDEGINNYGKVDILFIVDISGSMRDYIDALEAAMETYVSDFAGTEHKFALITTPPRPLSYDDYEVRTGVPGNMLTDVTGFNSELDGLLVNGYGSIEPTYDAAYYACSPSDIIGVNWRADAHPYVIMLTDETPQSYHGRSQSSVTPFCRNCQVGDCEPGEPFDFYVITKPDYNSMWIDIVNSDPNRIKDININDTTMYLNMLRDIFTDICR